MALRIACPSCKATYNIDDDMRGKRIACRFCEKPMQIPAPRSVAPAPAKPPQAKPSEFQARPAPPRPAGANPGNTPHLASSTNQNRAFARSTAKARSNAPVILIVAGLCALGLIVCVVAVAAVLLLKPNSGQNVADGQPAAQNGPKDNKPDPPPPEGKGETPGKTKPADTPKQGSNPGSGGQLTKDVLTRIKEATVYVRVTLADGRVGQGSGFFGVEPGVVLTNAHVLGMFKYNSQAPKKIQIVYKSGEQDSRTFDAAILGVDGASDLAVLRVDGANLPTPLDVRTSTDLVETQTVYIVGFPFGESLGKNVSIVQSSVSSLRKNAEGEMSRVQVNGGMHPGNSGGPVVNADGEVVGVAVAIIEGTQINFAIPCERVHHVTNGRLSNYSVGPTVREGGYVKVRVFLELLDPLKRIQDVACEWWTGPDGKSRPAAVVQPQPQTGDSPNPPHRLAVDFKGGKAFADVLVPANLPGHHVIFVQPVVVNGSGKKRWYGSISFTPDAPIEKQPASLALKHMWGSRPITFTTTAKIQINSAASEDVDVTIAVNATMAESMVGLQNADALLRLHYLTFDIGLPPKLQTGDFKEKMNRAVKHVGAVHADLVVDDKNNLKKNVVDLHLAPRDNWTDLKDLHKQIHESLEILAVPLPGRLVQPGETWKSKRALMIFTGARGDPAPIEVTYSFHGIRQHKGRAEAVIAISGQANDRLDSKTSVTGRVNGMAYFDLAASQMASATAKADLILLDGGKEMMVTLESKMERALGQELLKKAGELTASDPRDARNCPFHVHSASLEADRPCVISMESPKGKGFIDTYLRLEDAAGATLAHDQDGGVDLNSMIVFRPKVTGNYRIVTTTSQPASGNYTLIVRQ